MLKLKELRRNKKATQKEVADSLGISFQSYSNYETGYRQPDYQTMIRLANYFNVTIDYLLGIETEQKKPIGEPISFERFTEILYQKGLTEKDIENLSKEQLSAIADIVKNFKP